MRRRVLIFGCSGSGKSTLARRLAVRLDVPVTHLDHLYWRPDWVEAPLPDFRAAVATAVRSPGWVIDGNYSRTLDLRLPLADTVVFLDVSRWTSLRRVLTRTWRERGQDTQAPGCRSKVDLELIRWIWGWRASHRSQLLARIATESPGAQQVLLGSRREVEAFLRTV
ncbi:DNA topology modulation protein FlaR [Amycolatopsis sp. PS_44_ISF1]|uniref:DNA topology modulation protein FlaR n=1 Tax=Amycolatopsis sp. PS_44_ISF1 TaxID=2974917 RepID=UPI0028DFE0FB|nr:DNA topology modulation protein FlaR [Amycolatopsis sp. PS_44_ISF1]MDT8910559.1 DNA topology modulation protein FlaR [Amycolatopsis sp. PS_44_ISF1]